MRICALCNGLQTVEIRCRECGEILKDSGPVSDYFGPYSPYESIDSLNEAFCCVHLLTCESCGNDIRQCAPECEI